MNSPEDILKHIIAYKTQEVADLKIRTNTATLHHQAENSPTPRGFKQALDQAAQTCMALIAEIKKASPSKGIIRHHFNPPEIAKAYAQGGATCLSVLTDTPSFQGSTTIFRTVRAISSLPILRKDFMIDPIQIIESRVLGADAILVILAMVSDGLASELIATAHSLGMDVIVEIHNQTELYRALNLKTNLLGINNRNLRNFSSSLETFPPLAALCPPNLTLIAESHIQNHADMVYLKSHGAKGFLVGESLMRQNNIETATRNLLTPPRL